MTWSTKAVKVLSATDAVAIVIAVFIAQFLRFGTDNNAILPIENDNSIGYSIISTALCLAWWIALWLGGSRDSRILGAGNDEYRKVISSSLWVFAFIAIGSYAGGIELARGYVLISAPLGIVVLLAQRWLFRAWIVRRRHKGGALIRTLVIGDAESTAHLVKTMRGARNYGYDPIGVYYAGLDSEKLPQHSDLPLLGRSIRPEEIMRTVREHAVDVVAISTGHMIWPKNLRKLGWLLADQHVGLIMAPALTDIAGPRFHTQPLNGLPLIHVSTPRMRGPAALAKRILDVFISGLALLVLSPLFLLLAIIIKIDSPRGPVFFAQQRVGLEGLPFSMYKFRSMVPNAEELKKQLMSQNEGHGVLFKMANDPRITRVGKFIRRYSLDELPQLWNVLTGEMSLVGPRPPLKDEVSRYEEDLHRRLLVKPGITGLWQISGRSDLPWEESARLDLYYVENWSVLGDILVLVKTLRAVVRSSGAY
ncbi:sugar transferase [Kocuria sp. HSID16901]|uniref:sugar transferase n=1 Tax=Kocuria sp. HSID16901 TaxID=2419505 RepID=UPI000F888EE5|nr:sugar transferase [Kocuria sp. HSID16901]RUQ23431.1 sugar transferase [Kocuria sp. HSID16901]